MISVLIYILSGLGSSPGQGQGQGVVYLGNTLCSHSASLHPGVEMGPSKLYAGDIKHPIQGGVDILLVTL